MWWARCFRAKILPRKVWPFGLFHRWTSTHLRCFLRGADGEVRALISPRTGEPVTQAATDPVTGEALMDDQGQPLRRPVLVQRNRAFTFATPGTTDNPEHQTVQPCA